VTNLKQFARVWVVTGFSLTALGSIVNFIQLLNNGYLGQDSVSADIQLFALPLGSLAALWAWWMLSKIATLVSDFALIFRSAFIALMIGSLCLCVEYVNLLWSTPSFSEFIWPFWFQGVGSFGTAVGFLLLARAFSTEEIVNKSSN
jgi:hypothetical protein